jgi:hypothetical protein
MSLADSPSSFPLDDLVVSHVSRKSLRGVKGMNSGPVSVIVVGASPEIME